MNEQIENQIRTAFRVAFARAIEQWTFDSRTNTDVPNLRYMLSAYRNEWCVKNDIRLDWSKPK